LWSIVVGTNVDSGPVELGSLRRACRICSLNELCWPLGLQPADLERLQATVQSVGPLQAGSYLFRCGDPFTAIYAVRSGCIKSFSFDESGRELVHGFHLVGQVLGFDAVYPDRHRCSAQALESSTLCAIPYRDIARLSIEFPVLQEHTMRLMGREFSHQLMGAERSTATQRVADFLLDIHSRLHLAGITEREVTLPMSREEISSYLGITPATLGRLLAKLEREGLIELEGRTVILVDPVRLDQISEGVSEKQVFSRH
jgi:CRP/FNR family transcriptional regulator